MDPDLSPEIITDRIKNKHGGRAHKSGLKYDVINQRIGEYIKVKNYWNLYLPCIRDKDKGIY